MTAKQKKAPAAPASPAKKAASLKVWQLDVIACILIYFAVVVMFHEIVLGGKTFASGDDTTNAIALNQYALRESEAREYPMWCPQMYGGFPSFSAGAYSTYEHMGAPYSLAYRWFSPRYWVDVITIKGFLIGGTLGSDTGGPDWLVALMLYGGLITYLLIRRLGLSVWIGLFCGIVFAWNPYLISIVTAAHGGKLITFIYIPLVLLATWNLLQNRRLLDMALLALAFGWQIAAGGHTQILLYSGFTILFACVVWAYFEFREGTSGNIGRAAAMTLGGIVLGVCVGSMWYIPLLEYTPYSIRGAGPALEAAVNSGYSMDQATMWSMMPSELITFLFPSWFGLKSPFYWGGMPFTSSSFYFGAVPFMLAILALFGRKTRLMWALIALSIFSILLSFGSYFPLFYGLFFDYFPFFNKFRTPSLILLLVVMSGIILAGYGIKFVIEQAGSEKWRKVFLYGAAACAAVLVIAMIGGEGVLGLFASGVKEGEAARYNAQQIAQIKTMRLEMLQKDVALVMLWIGLAFTACYLYVTNKLKSSALIGGLAIITVIDLFMFSNQFFETRPRGHELDGLKSNRVIDYLKQDKSRFRVYPAGPLNQDNRYVYWDVESMGGYHGAKMRSWQDIQDYVVSATPNRRFPLNVPFLSSLNCKYIITNAPLPNIGYVDSVTADPAAGMILYRNPNALERAYYVDSVIVVQDRKQTFEQLQKPQMLFDYMAVIDGPLPGPLKRDPNRTVEFAYYSPHEVRMSAKNNEPSFLVLADAHYEPGWEAMVDGRPSRIYLVNGFVRGLYLPPGDHSIIYRYTGKDETRGETVATVSYFLVLGLAVAGYLSIRRRKAGTA